MNSITIKLQNGGLDEEGSESYDLDNGWTVVALAL